MIFIVGIIIGEIIGACVVSRKFSCRDYKTGFDDGWNEALEDHFNSVGDINCEWPDSVIE